MKKTLFDLWLTAKRAHNPVPIRLLALLAMAMVGFLILLFSPVWILARNGGRRKETDYFNDMGWSNLSGNAWHDDWHDRRQ